METVFLKDGRMADLVTKTDKGFLVDPYITWNDYEGQQESGPSGAVEIVPEVFKTAPVELIEAEYKKWADRVESQKKDWEQRQTEFQKLNSDVQRLRNEKTNLSRYIINREELRTAKRLILWPQDQIAPVIMDGTKSHKFNVSYEICQYAGEERAWSYSLHSEKDGNWLSSQYFDQQYGIKTDLTDEEILQLTTERIKRLKSHYNWNYILLRAPDQWLSPEYLEEKKAFKEKEQREELSKAQKELEAAQKKLNDLQAKQLVSTQ